MLNKVIINLAKIPVYLLLFLYSYFLAFVALASIIVIVCCAISVVSNLPLLLAERFYVVLLLPVPVAFIFFFKMIFGKENNTKDSSEFFEALKK